MNADLAISFGGWSWVLAFAGTAAQQSVQLTHAELPRPPPAAARSHAVLRVADHLFAAAASSRRSGAGDGGRRTRSRGDRADSQAIPPRSAAAGPVRLLGQGRGVGRSRRIDAH